MCSGACIPAAVVGPVPAATGAGAAGRGGTEVAAGACRKTGGQDFSCQLNGLLPMPALPGPPAYPLDTGNPTHSPPTSKHSCKLLQT